MIPCCISFALLLIAIAAGMFLLAKTNKDNLGNFFRFVSWFIIVSGLLGVLFCGMTCMFCICCPGMEHEKMMMFRHGPGTCDENMQWGERHMMMKKFYDDDECPMMKKNCCKGEEEGNCCKEEGEKNGCCDKGNCDKNMKIKKDTVIIKTKQP